MDKELSDLVLKTFGIQHQLDIGIEELAEGIQCISKLKRYHNGNINTNEIVLKDKLAQEIADIYLSLSHLIVHYDMQKTIDMFYSAKEKRLYERVEERK